MKNKYKNKKVYVDGMVFDSQKEYHRWCELKLLEQAGKIKDLQRQVPFELIPAQYNCYPRYGKKGKRLKDGKKILEHPCIYKADFTYWEDGIYIVEDSKGKRTADYVIKRKLMLLRYHIQIKET